MSILRRFTVSNSSKFDCSLSMISIIFIRIKSTKQLISFRRSATDRVFASMCIFSPYLLICLSCIQFVFHFASYFAFLSFVTKYNLNDHPFEMTLSYYIGTVLISSGFQSFRHCAVFQIFDYSKKSLFLSRLESSLGQYA